jgi:hypothetical protein
MHWAALLADVILVVHFAIVVFVLAGQALVLAGGPLAWAWVRNFWFRLVHLGTIVWVTVQAWLGELCPLTIWEHDLRRHAGQAAHEQSFMEYWVGELLFHDLPWWVFVLAYTLFLGLVLWSWWRWPPYRRGRPVLP